jgi:hypothetical protein
VPENAETSQTAASSWQHRLARFEPLPWPSMQSWTSRRPIKPLTWRAQIVLGGKKVRAALGKENEKAIQGKAAEWAEEFEKNRARFDAAGWAYGDRTHRAGCRPDRQSAGPLQPAAHNQATEN